MQKSETQVNMHVDGAAKDYLLLYFVFLPVWVWVCLSNKLSTHRIHLLTGALILMKALNLICSAEDKKHYVLFTGTPHGWGVLFYIFQFIRVTLSFNVTVLIVTGWSLLKPLLQGREKKVMGIVILLQVVGKFTSVLIRETSSVYFFKDWEAWSQVFLLTDLACRCAIILRKTDGNEARNAAKLTLLRQFYVLVIRYLFFSGIMVFLLCTNPPDMYEWVNLMAPEYVNLAFYWLMLHAFGPVRKNLLAKL